VASQNTLRFFQPGRTVQTIITGAFEDRISGIVPNGVEQELYRVTVNVNRSESNGGGFEVNGFPPS